MLDIPINFQKQIWRNTYTHTYTNISTNTYTYTHTYTYINIQTHIKYGNSRPT